MELVSGMQFQNSGKMVLCRAAVYILNLKGTLFGQRGFPNSVNDFDDIRICYIAQKALCVMTMIEIQLFFLSSKTLNDSHFPIPSGDMQAHVSVTA